MSPPQNHHWNTSNLQCSFDVLLESDYRIEAPLRFSPLFDDQDVGRDRIIGTAPRISSAIRGSFRQANIWIVTTFPRRIRLAAGRQISPKIVVSKFTRCCAVIGTG